MAISRINSGTRSAAASHAVGSSVRTVPDASPCSGMTLVADPAATRPQTRERPARAGTADRPRIGRPGDRAGSDGNLTGVDPGIGVEGENPHPALEGTGLQY